MEPLLRKLKDWIKVIQTAILGAIFVEAVLVIVIGVASNNLDKVYWLGILLSCAVIYLFLTIIKAAYQIRFPSSIVDELIAKRELEEKNKLFARQSNINEYISKAIQSLNTQTCNIQSVEDGKNLCDQELGVRLKDLLQSFVLHADVLLDAAINRNFTIGLYLDFYYKHPHSLADVFVGHYMGEDFVTEAPGTSAITDHGIILLKDDLNLQPYIPKELFLTEVNGPSFEVQSALKRSFNNLRFFKHQFSIEEQSYSIITAEILEVCSDDNASGVLFIIGKNDFSYPADLPEVLKIFNRIVANYVSRYNDCLKKAIIAKKKAAPATKPPAGPVVVSVPPEVQHLRENTENAAGAASEKPSQ